MATGKTTKRASPSRPFKAADHLRSWGEIAAYVEAMLEDGDARAVPIALREVLHARVGGLIYRVQPDWKLTTVQVDDLREWLSKRGIKTGFFSPQSTDSPDYLDPQHPR